MRDYPAYGRTIAAHIQRGQKPIVVAVLLSSRWRYFDNVPKICIRPDEWRRRRYEFGYLGGMHVVAVPGDECTECMLAELLLDLMEAAPALLWAWNVDGSKLYDDDSPTAVAHWVHELTRGEIHFRDAKLSAALMAEAQLRLATQRGIELERILQRSLEDGIRFHERERELEDRVRKLFFLSTDARAA